MLDKIDESKINSPSHYNIEGELETIKKMEMYMAPDKLISWCEGCIFSYIDRAKHKNGLEDLHKAMWHVNYVLNQNNNLKREIDYKIPYKKPVYTFLKFKIFHFLSDTNFIPVKIILQYMIDNYDNL